MSGLAERRIGKHVGDHWFSVVIVCDLAVRNLKTQRDCSWRIVERCAL
jgi:hypothetical protein